MQSVLAKLALQWSELKRTSIINLVSSLICYLLAFKISTLLSLGNNARCHSNNSEVCADEVVIGIVRTKKNKHKKSTIITKMLPFGFYNINIKLSLGDNKRCHSKNSAVNAGKVGIAMVRTEKNKHNKSSIIPNMLPFGFYNINIKLFLGEERPRSKLCSLCCKIGIAIVRLKKNKHNKYSIIPKMLPFGF